MALIEFKNLPDTSTPLTAENLNNNFNYLAEKNIISVGLTTNYSYDGNNGELLIPINTEVNKVGTKLTLDTTNNKVKVGSDINYVLVSFNVNIYDSSPLTANSYNRIRVFKNGTVVSKSSMRTDAKNNRQLVTMANFLIPVQENDEITFKVYSSNSSTTFTIESNDTTFIIQAI